MSQPLEGVSGTAYLSPSHDEAAALDRLRRQYDEIRARHGGIAPALATIASMLDIAAVGAREGLRPDVVPLLLEAIRRLR